MRLHRLAHASRYWQPIVTEWPRPQDIQLAMPSAIQLGWMTTLEGGPAARAAGAGVTWRIDLVLGGMSIPGETPDHRHHGVACLLLRPLVGPALDQARLAQAYRAWHKAKLSAWEQGKDSQPDAGRARLADLILSPPTGPTLSCEPQQDEQAAWRTVTEAWDEVEQYQAAALNSEGPSKPTSTLLRDQPYLLAYEDTPERLWDPEQYQVKPTMDSCADLVPTIEPQTGRGRPRSFAPVATTMAIIDALVGLGDDAPRARLEPEEGHPVDMRALFAMELVLDDRSVGRSERDWLESWLLGGHERAITPADLRRRSTDLRKKLENWNTARKTGRRDTSLGATEVRKILPTLIFDRSVFLKPWGDDGSNPWEDTDTTLVDWLRSPRVEELMDIVTGRRRDRLSMACIPGDFHSFMENRGLPFHRVRVRFEPQDDGYRGAVAMKPGAQPGEVVEIDLTGFAETPDELRWRWFDSPVGQVLYTHTVPAGQPWPPLAPSSITSPPPSSLGT